MSEKSARLRATIAAKPILVMPGVGDPITARLAEQVGFQAVFASGAAIANMSLGLPDLGLATLTEVVQMVHSICGSTSLPVFADADNGYGNTSNVARTVREFERAGAAGIMLEDQVTPKRCGHFEGKQVVPLDEMLQKIVTFKRARSDPSLVLIGRTDAIAVLGFEEAVRRGRAFARAGADLVFLEAPIDEEQLRAIPRAIDAPTLANMVEGGKTPLKTAAELQEIGYSAVVFANTAARVGWYAVREALSTLFATGSSQQLIARMLAWEERQALVDLDKYALLEDQTRLEAMALLNAGSQAEPKKVR